MPSALAGSAGALRLARRRGSSRLLTGRDVARFHGNPTLHLDHPRRSLVEVLAKRRKHPSLGEVLDQLPNDVAVRTQHDLVELGVVEESIRGLEPSAFGQAGLGLDLQLVRVREGLDGLHAPHVRAAVHRCDVVGGECGDELFGLLYALLAEGTLAVVAGPVAATAGLGMPHEIESAQVLIQVRRRLLSSAFHTLGHFALASLAATCSIAISSPAANARRPVARTLRSQACAVTLSWCSPSTACSFAAARAKLVATGPATACTASAA